LTNSFLSASQRKQLYCFNIELDKRNHTTLNNKQNTEIYFTDNKGKGVPLHAMEAHGGEEV
jgi:hypothetical protein